MALSRHFAAVLASLALSTTLSVSAEAATLVKATFQYELYLDDGSIGLLDITALFDTNDAFLSDDEAWLMFPSDAGEGVDRLKTFSFTGLGSTSADLDRVSDRFRSAFFDVSVYGGTVFAPEPGGAGYAYTAFADFGSDAAGCAVGLTPAFFGLGAGDDGNCRTVAYDSGAPSSYKFERVQGGGETAVPEPTTWALLIAGFGLVGAALRRRRGPLALKA